jgi:hypothetical protein
LAPSVAAEIFKNDPRGVLAWGPSTSKNAKAWCGHMAARGTRAAT